jgi:ferritin-like protein
MEPSAKMGMNRTGSQMSPLKVESMVSFAESAELDVRGDEQQLSALRETYISEASRVGSVPIPGTLKGAVTTGIEKLTGDRPEMLIDKLGERLAFERTGVRLYDALIAKCEAAQEGPNPPPLEELNRFRDEEAAHFKLIASTIESLGADPTAQTPCADITGVASMGIMQVLTDPRTDVPQCLNALLTAELTDNAGWELLINLADTMGHDDMADDFRTALGQEEIHLQSVRQWLEDAVISEGA